MAFFTAATPSVCLRPQTGSSRARGQKPRYEIVPFAIIHFPRTIWPIGESAQSSDKASEPKESERGSRYFEGRRVVVVKRGP